MIQNVLKNNNNNKSLEYYIYTYVHHIEAMSVSLHLMSFLAALLLITLTTNIHLPIILRSHLLGHSIIHIECSI